MIINIAVKMKWFTTYLVCSWSFTSWHLAILYVIPTVSIQSIKFHTYDLLSCVNPLLLPSSLFEICKLVLGVEREKKSVTCLRIWCRRECMSNLCSKSLSRNKLEKENIR